MTQDHQAAATAEQQQPDGLARIWAEIRKERDRIRRIQEPTPKKIVAELADTAMSYAEDTVGYLVQFRNWVVETVGDIDGRLTALEDDQPIPFLTKEDGAMLLDLAGRCEGLAKLVLEQSGAGIAAEAKQQLDETLLRCQLAVAWVADNIEGDEDDDEPDDGDDDGDEEDDSVNAVGGAS